MNPAPDFGQPRHRPPSFDWLGSLLLWGCIVVLCAPESWWH